MKQYIAHIALVVEDYDEAIRFYTGKLKFIVVEDTILSDTKRWILISPKGSQECCILLAKAADAEQKKRSVIRPAEEFFYFYILMIFGGIMLI